MMIAIELIMMNGMLTKVMGLDQLSRLVDTKLQEQVKYFVESVKSLWQLTTSGDTRRMFIVGRKL